MNTNPAELNRLARYRSVCNRISLGEAIAELSQPNPANDLRRDVNLKARIMGTASRLVDSRARALQAETQQTYAAAVNQVLADDPDLKRAYANGE